MKVSSGVLDVVGKVGAAGILREEIAGEIGSGEIRIEGTVPG
jgi:hypothetical protein